MVDLSIEVHVGRNIEQRHLAASDTGQVDRQNENDEDYFKSFLEDGVVLV